MTPEFREWFKKVILANFNFDKNLYDWMGLEDDVWDKILEERELCAKIAETHKPWIESGREIAQAIRARGEK